MMAKPATSKPDGMMKSNHVFLLALARRDFSVDVCSEVSGEGGLSAGEGSGGEIKVSTIYVTFVERLSS